MSVLRKRFCIFGCDSLVVHGANLHRFPNPEKRPDLFAAWVSAAGDYLKEKDPKKVFKNKRICDHHFNPTTKTTGGRLIWSAIPTINLHRVQQSIATVVEADHSYCGPRREYFQSRPLADITNTPGPSSADNAVEFSIPSGSSSTTCFTSSDKHHSRTRKVKFDAEIFGHLGRYDGDCTIRNIYRCDFVIDDNDDDDNNGGGDVDDDDAGDGDD
ncbi:hypothetical protein MSG28_013582 [Choristoneura fumiferana]|uniref:Uncharacterized protein n=1 Tax=Choristoneura fumiferana TaxID=7141 RepID=A0ACC0K8K7_CHOFU|nr:hypothetical protein MSG28_013582 [Choristoneura fumiferana]